MIFLGRAAEKSERTNLRQKSKIWDNARLKKIKSGWSLKIDAAAFCAAALPWEGEEHFEIILFAQRQRANLKSHQDLHLKGAVCSEGPKLLISCRFNCLTPKVLIWAHNVYNSGSEPLMPVN